MGPERKIVFVNRFFFPDESATAQIVADLAEYLCANGLRVCVVTGNSTSQGSGPLPRSETVLGGVQVKRVRHAGGRRRSLSARLVQLLSFYPLAFGELLRNVARGDVLIAKTDPPLISVVAWLAATLKGARLANWLQDVYPEVAARLHTPIVGGIFGRWLEKLSNKSLKAAAVNVAIGRRMAETLVAKGLPADRVRVIPNWADERGLRPIEPRKSRSRTAWGFAHEDFVVGYSGNLGRAHESRTLLEAARLVRYRRDIKFLFIGGGHEFDRLETVAKREGLSNFMFRPHQPRDQLQDTLAAADVHWLSLRPELEGLIVPSKFYGILAAGRPVVAVSALDGEIGMIVRKHGCGIAVEPGDGAALAEAITRLADDPAQRRDLGVRARLLSETLFARESALRSWIELIQSLLDSGDRGQSGKQ